MSTEPKCETCQVPPPGWYCTREPGHEPPCAALPNHTASDSPRMRKALELIAKLVGLEDVDFFPPTRRQLLIGALAAYGCGNDTYSLEVLENTVEALS